MHHEFTASYKEGLTGRERERPSDAAYIWTEPPSVSVVGEEIPASLPSEGYRILNGPPPISLPMTSERIASGYTSIAQLEDGGYLRFKHAFMSALPFATRNWSSMLFIFVPVGMLAPRLGWSDSVVFVMNCLAIVPLADGLCRATDNVSVFLGETAGALLNVTMGNATEVVLFIHALLQRQYMIVRTSLLGSIVVNVLLVLGLAMVTGESQQHGQSYNRSATRMAAGLLCLATSSLLLPSVLHISTDSSESMADILTLSRATSVVLIIVYVVYLYSQIISTKYTYKPLIQLDPDTIEQAEVVHMEEFPRSSIHRRTLSCPRYSSLPDTVDNLQPPGPDPASVWKESMAKINMVQSMPFMQKALPVLALITSAGLVSICGGYLVDSIDHFVDHSPISKTMTGLIILPIVGNAAELVSGVMFASRKQMDLAFAVSIGSAIQIALFVTPLMVVAGWAMGRDMALHLTVFEAITLITSTALFGGLVLDDRCSLLKGVSLFAGYAVIAFSSYFVSTVS